MTTPRRPPGRYDEPRALPRPVLVVGAAVLIAALTAGAWWAFQRSREGRVDVAVTGYEVESDTAVTIRFELRKPRGRDATCGVEALDRRGAVVGSATVRVDDPGEQVTTSRRLVTAARAATAIVTGCVVEAVAP